MVMAKADLIIRGARVITLNPRIPQARGVACAGGKILRVGEEKGLEAFLGSGTRVIDARGKAVLPGFIDAHLHFFALASSLLAVDCSPASVISIKNLQARIRERASVTPPGTWIRAWGYNEFYLAEKRHPNRWDLDEAAPLHPVRLQHRSLHASVLNSLALAQAGLRAEAPDPPQGFVERDERGEPTGLLLDLESYLSGKVLPPPTPAELEEGVRRANRLLLSCGITSFCDATATNDQSQWQAFRRLKEEGRLQPRVTMMIGERAGEEFQGPGAPSGDEGLRLGPVKFLCSDCPSPEEVSSLQESVLRAHRAGLQVALHALEEEGVAAALAALEYALHRKPGPHRHRLEHCSLCPPELLARLRALRPVVVTQPSFVYFSGERYEAQVPLSKQPWLYRIGSLLRSGVRVAASSDAPVVSPNPLVGLYAAMTRRPASGPVLGPEERVSIRQALKMYTLSAAYASFEEEAKGSLARGKVADMVLLSRDPTVVSPEELLETRVEMTLVGGEVAWEA